MARNPARWSKVVDFYEEEVEEAVALSSRMEPLIMAVLAVLIGGVVAMCLPVFRRRSVVG